MIAVVILSGLAGGAVWLMQVLNLDVNQQTWSVSEVVFQAGNRLKAIATTLDTARERLARDPTIDAALASGNAGKLFSGLHEGEIEFASRLPDSTLYFNTPHGLQSANRGFAIYSGEGKLLAWNSPLAATFGLDTVLSGSILLPNRDQAVLLENGPIYAYMLSIRKLVSSDGRTQAFVVSKQQLATKEPIGAAPPTNFLDDFSTRAGREVKITFGGKPGSNHSDSIWVRQDLLADPADPTSFIGSLSVKRVPQAEPSMEYQIVYEIWVFSFTLALFSVLLWFLIAIAEIPQELKPVNARVVYSLMALAALFLARVAIAEAGAFAALFGQQYQHAADFTSDWGFGIASNPLELFITSVFATAATVMLWIIGMPRERLVRDASQERHLERPRTDHPVVLLLL